MFHFFGGGGGGGSGGGGASKGAIYYAIIAMVIISNSVKPRLTKCQGTEENCSLYRGLVISNSSI